jgi:hypothetical protein
LIKDFVTQSVTSTHGGYELLILTIVIELSLFPILTIHYMG